MTGLVGISNLISRLAHEFAASAYSQDQEFEADRLGVRLMVAAGCSRDAAVRMLQRLEVISEANDLGISSYLASHPPLAERIGRVKRMSQPGKDGR